MLYYELLKGSNDSLQDFATACLWFVTDILDECAVFICRLTNCLGRCLHRSGKEMSWLCRQVARNMVNQNHGKRGERSYSKQTGMMEE